MIFRTIFWQQYYSGSRTRGLLSGRSLTVVTVNPREAFGYSCFEFLFCTRDFRPSFACSIHLVGSLWCFADTRAPDSPLAAYGFSCLGHSYRVASLAVSFDRAGELARRRSRSRAIPRWVPAPLPGQAGLSRHFFNHANDSGCNHLRFESWVLWPANLDRSTPIAPDAPRSLLLYFLSHKTRPCLR
jgi:hypothetical protein